MSAGTSQDTDVTGTLIGLIGKDCTLKLVEAFGGKRIYIAKPIAKSADKSPMQCNIGGSALAAPARTPEPPPEAAELVACIGVDATFALIELRGGTDVYVPYVRGVKTSQMTEKLGEPAMMALAREYGGNVITVPLCRAWRARIYLHRGGMSQAEIALAIGCTQDMVQRLSRTDRVPEKATPGRLAKQARPVRV